MTTAQKLTTIAENVEKVYEAGKAAGVGVPVVEKDVNFYDYDGTLLYSYTLDEIQALTELPTPKSPDPEYLVFQEWNWSLEELKNLHDVMDVGANYQTVDGCTKLFLTIDDEKQLTVALHFRWNTEINWGDGTTTSAGESQISSHTYDALGDYVISCSGWTSGMRCTASDSIGALALRKVYVGDAVSAFTFADCANLKSISSPNNGKLGMTYEHAFRFTSAPFFAFPKGVTSLGYRAARDAGYKLLSFSNTLKTIDEYSIYGGSALLAKVIFPPSLTALKTYSFYGYSHLQKVTIPANVTEIGNNAFGSCPLLYEVHMKPTTPPTLGGTNAFANGNANRIIYVPKGCLSAYQTATNWSTYASQMREEES